MENAQLCSCESRGVALGLCVEIWQNQHLKKCLILTLIVEEIQGKPAFTTLFDFTTLLLLLYSKQ